MKSEKANTFTLTVLHFLISLDKHLLPFFGLSSHWLRQISESHRICQVKCLLKTKYDWMRVRGKYAYSP